MLFVAITDDSDDVTMMTTSDVRSQHRAAALLTSTAESPGRQSTRGNISTLFLWTTSVKVIAPFAG